MTDALLSSLRVYAAKRRQLARGSSPADQAVALASWATGISPEEMRGRSRRPKIAAARALAYSILRARGMSLPRIGRYFGRDHTTVLAALRKLGRAGLKTEGER